MTNPKPPTPPIAAEREFNKVDRALEMQVIDWLQWGEFPYRLDKPSMPALALELIAKRKAAVKRLEAELAQARAEINKLKEYETSLQAANRIICRRLCADDS